MVSKDATALEQPQEEVQQPSEAEETQPSVEGGETPVEGAVEQPEGAADGAEAPRTYTQEEVSKIQSELDKQVNEVRLQVKAMEEKQTQSEASRQAEAQWTQTQQELDKRDASENKAAEDAGLDLAPVKALQVERRQVAQQRIQLQQMHVQAEQGAKMNVAHSLAQKYSLTDIQPLLSATSPEHMEAMAKLQQMEANQVKVETEVAEAKRPAQTFESAVPSPGEGGGDRAFIKAWGAGDIDATPENIARAQKLQGRLI